MSHRCRLFRLRPGHHTPVHRSTACLRCWAVCRNEALPGRSWCSDCEQAALDSADPLVTKWITDLTEPDHPGSVLDDLED